jgi:ribonuclease HI
MQNPVFVEAEVQTWINENSSENDVIIYTGGSVVRHVQSSWGFTVQVGRTVHEDSGAFRHTTSSMTMEVMAVTKALSWLGTQAFTNACVVSDFMSMLRNIEAGWRRREWLVSLRRSNLYSKGTNLICSWLSEMSPTEKKRWHVRTTHTLSD